MSAVYFGQAKNSRTMRREWIALTLCLSLTTSAQQFTSVAEYDAWKLSLFPFTAGAVSASSASAGNVRGGGADSCSCWIEPDASFVTLDNDSDFVNAGFPTADDGSFGPITLPFSFELFGSSYNEVYINVNGNLSFEEPYGAYTASGFPLSNYKMVAPFWADVDLRGDHPDTNIVQYRLTATSLVVSWTRVGYYLLSTDKVNTFSVVITDGEDPLLPEGQNVGFCYKDMQWTTGLASSGVNGFEGDPATVGVNKGDGLSYAQVGRFNQDNADYDGPFDMFDGVHWLDDSYFRLSSTGAQVPPVLGNTFACDTIVVQVGQSVDVSLYALGASPGQSVTAAVSAPTMPSLVVGPIQPGDYTPIALQIAPTSDELGWNTLTVIASTIQPPVLTTTSYLVVQVVDGSSTGLLEEERLAARIVPNPASNDFRLIRVSEAAGTMQVFDARGRSVMQRSLRQGERTVQVDVSSFEPGCYWVRMRSDQDEISAVRLVVVR